MSNYYGLDEKLILKKNEIVNCTNNDKPMMYININEYLNLPPYANNIKTIITISNTVDKYNTLKNNITLGFKIILN